MLSQLDIFNYYNDLENIIDIRVKYYTTPSFNSIPINSYKNIAIDLSAIYSSRYTLVPLACGFTGDSTLGHMCVISSISVSGKTLAITIRNNSTNSNANVKPTFLVMRVKAL